MAIISSTFGMFHHSCFLAWLASRRSPPRQTGIFTCLDFYLSYVFLSFLGFGSAHCGMAVGEAFTFFHEHLSSRDRCIYRHLILSFTHRHKYFYCADHSCRVQTVFPIRHNGSLREINNYYYRPDLTEARNQPARRFKEAADTQKG